LHLYTTTCGAPTEYTQSGNDHFHHDGKISPGWRGWGVHTHPLSTITYKVVVYAPPERADTLPLFILFPYMYSVNEPFKIFLFTKSIEVI
jgi:hypothetical protein